MIHAMKAPNAERPYIIHSTTADAGMIRGGDMALAMLGKIDMDVSSDWAKNDPTNIYCLREAAKNILYVVAQSNVMNHVTTYADDTAARNDLGCYMPGDNVDMKVELITPIAIENGLRFAIREGGRTVGSGVVGKIIE